MNEDADDGVKWRVGQTKVMFGRVCNATRKRPISREVSFIRVLLMVLWSFSHENNVQRFCSGGSQYSHGAALVM